MTPDRASLHTLQYVGLAWEQAYQLCIPLKWSMLYWVDWDTHTHTHSEQAVQRPVSVHWDGRDETDLIILSVLDAAQRRHPILHFLPVVCTKDEAPTGRDHLKQTGAYITVHSQSTARCRSFRCHTSNFN